MRFFPNASAPFSINELTTHTGDEYTGDALDIIFILCVGVASCCFVKFLLQNCNFFSDTDEDFNEIHLIPSSIPVTNPEIPQTEDQTHDPEANNDIDSNTIDPEQGISQNITSESAI